VADALACAGPARRNGLYGQTCGAARGAAELLLPGALSVISVRLAYWPAAVDAQKVLDDAELAYVSRYALGRDYHKTVRQRLQKLADRLRQEVATLDLAEPFACRVFSDSAPVMETDFARQAGIAWRGKHTLSLTREGSWHFLGEIYSTLPLPPIRRSPIIAATAGAASTPARPQPSSPPTKWTPGYAFRI
jgi:epoxyqueuosine reductase